MNISNRTLNLLASAFLCLVIPACTLGILHGLDREAEIRQAGIADFCRAHPVQCDMAVASLRRYELGRE